MSKSFFIKLVTDPAVDPRKCLVGLACAAQAAQDGHRVEVFFASHAVRLLQSNYLSELDERAGVPGGLCREFFDKLVTAGVHMHCSSGSQGLIGMTREDPEGLLVPGIDLNWSDPAGVIALCVACDVHLVY